MNVRLQHVGTMTTIAVYKQHNRILPFHLQSPSQTNINNVKTIHHHICMIQIVIVVYY